MSTKLIQHGWESYRRNVVPADASPIQINETRQAFYAGASILFEALMRVMDSDDEAASKGTRVMNDLQTEVSDFGAELDQSAFGQKPH